MSKLPFKQMEVVDRFTPERIATFERPQADNDTIIIRIEQAGDFHLDAGTLKVIAEVLALSAPNRQLAIGN
jgi:hypothetical protein